MRRWVVAGVVAAGSLLVAGAGIGVSQAQTTSAFPQIGVSTRVVAGYPIGGLWARKITGWCEAHYIKLVTHNPLGPVCTAATIHFCAAINNFAQLEYSHRNAAAWQEDLFPTFPKIEGTAFPLPTAPGLGVTFDEVVAASTYPFDYWDAPKWHRRDGQLSQGATDSRTPGESRAGRSAI